MVTTLPSFRFLADQVEMHIDDLYTRYLALSPRRRFYLHLILALNFIALAVFLYIGPDVIFNKTAALALWTSNQSYGLPLIFALVTLLSFPPLFGYGTLITMCGLGWGIAAPDTKEHPAMHGSLIKGWAVASTACLLGASTSFVVLRWLIRRNANVANVERILKDDKFRAMKEAVGRKGTNMVILIRFCPFPFCYSNLFFASLDTVSFRQFFFATALITPKLLLHVFVGARMFELMDSEERAKLDGWHKVLNVLYIVVGSVVGALTGWLVWKETQKILDSMTQSEEHSDRGRDFVVEFDADRDELDDDEQRDFQTPIDEQEVDSQQSLLPKEGEVRKKRGASVQPFKLIDDDEEDEEQVASRTDRRTNK